MSNVGQPERLVQNRLIQHITRPEATGGLGYAYLGNWEYRLHNSNVEETLLRNWLTGSQLYSPEVIEKAMFAFIQATRALSKGLYFANKDVYSLLRYGVKVRPDTGENTETVWLIDWKNPASNDFGLAEEVTVTGAATKRPDIVLYVNGIALGVLELKRGIVNVAEGIRQNLDNQLPAFIEPFFSTVQLVMAGNDTEGLRYGVIQTPEKYYLAWHEDGEPTPTATDRPLDWAVSQMLPKARFLALIHDFMVYDRGTKKAARSHQYHGVVAAQARLRRREGGIIWHTQGSGKSLTMVWLANWVLENLPQARVLIVTDRDELDKQIEKVFMGVGQAIVRTRSGAELLTKLNQAGPSLLCSLVHKFGRADNTGAKTDNYDGFIAELNRSVPADFRPKGDLYVFVDECHRTQSGKLNEAMKALLPNALFVGFTGTPLLNVAKEAEISTAIFGSYIHRYNFDRAIRDGVILDLRYEARDVDQRITSAAKIDQWFESKTRNLTENARIALKKRWGTLRTMYSSQSRLSAIVGDIVLDMSTRSRLESGSGNAMLVSDSIYNACKYYELFQATDLAGKCAIVTSYRPNPGDLKGETTGEGLTERMRKYEIYTKMLGGKEPEAFEDEVKTRFIDHPGQMKLLIVVDKLLTGFDAPSATYLYIDKHMQDHGLFQAVCRVNRLDGEDKDYGYIIDYKDLFQSLEKSMYDYTTGALGGFAREDVAGLLGDRITKGRQHLDETLEVVETLCELVAAPRNDDDYRHYFNGPDPTAPEPTRRRSLLYRSVAALLRAYADIANDLAEAGYSPTEIARLKETVRHYEAVRVEIRLSSGDAPDLKQYEPAMRHLIDTYIRAEDSRLLTTFENMSLVELLVRQGKAGLDALPASIRDNPEAMAETIENNVRRLIINEQVTNPIYFGKMSALLDDLVKRRKEGVEAYEDYLTQVLDVARQVTTPSGSHYPPAIHSRGQQALYDTLDQDEALTLALDQVVHYTARNGWLDNNDIKKKEVRNAVRKVLQAYGRPDDDAATAIVQLVAQQDEYKK
jgi:type I restriction enzyme, R subunit